MKKIMGFIFLFISVITHAQNVGIGTANPAFKLDVKNGSINTDSVYRIGAITILAVPEVGNLFIGKEAGIINTGSYNTFGGNLAGLSNTIGGSNSFFGQTSGLSNNTGDHNSFFGRSSGFYNTTGNSNSFYGRSAAYNNTTGNYNTALGNYSLSTITTGSLNTGLGYNANVNTGILTNATSIGANARVDCNNCLVLGSVNGINGATAGVNVGIGTTSPNPSAQLDVSSTAKGFLPPRMTIAQRNAIASPVATALTIWCSDCGVYGQMQAYNGIVWRNMMGGVPAGIPSIGDNDGGGKVAYILQPGDAGYIAGEVHGLIAANSDMFGASQWGCYGTFITGTSTALGTGQLNTIAIVNACNTTGIAARICNDLVENGYDDWYLPSQDELNKLCLNKIAIGGFGSFYWSSSQVDVNIAMMLRFSSCLQDPTIKSTTNGVRAIRAF